MKYQNKSFDIKGFKAPEVEHASIYGWFWNGPVSKEKTEEQILEMKRLGIRAFYIVAQPKVFRPTTIPTRLEPEYLSEEFFEHIKFAIEKTTLHKSVYGIYQGDARLIIFKASIL